MMRRKGETERERETSRNELSWVVPKLKGRKTRKAHHTIGYIPRIFNQAHTPRIAAVILSKRVYIPSI
jgi:hypothetical protein